MASWQKLLGKMVADEDPRSYTYEEAAGILLHLGFAPPTKARGSHRRFRIEIDDPGDTTRKRGIVVGLVEKGRGRLKPRYISEMVRTLKENNLLPDL